MASYIRKSLAEGEEIVREGAWPVVYWAFTWTVLALAVVIGAIWPFYLGWLTLIALIWFAMVAVHMATTRFAVTSQRVALKRGWLTLKTQEIAVSNVEEVRVEQSLVGRLFGFGRVLVTGTGEGVILFPPMGEPIRFRQAIETARTRARTVAPSAAPHIPKR